MEIEIFKQGLKRIEAAGIRSFKESHFGLLYKDLSRIGNAEWANMVSDYIQLEYIPKSFTGWFMKRYEESVRVPKMEDDFTSGVYGGEYSWKDVGYFFACIKQANRIWNGKSKEYRSWADHINRKWMGKTGNELTLFLEEHLAILNKEPSVRYGKSELAESFPKG